MFKKTTLLVAAGAGYVLGAKAGKERYAQIEAKFREIAGMPAVQSATTTVVETASSVADTAKAAATEKAAAVADTAKDVADTAKDKVKSSKTTGSTPTAMAGAAASGSAPDVTRP